MSDEAAQRPDSPVSKQAVETRLGRFFQRVNQLFKREPPKEVKLSGRIHELQTTANNALLELLTFKNSLEKQTDAYLFSQVCGVIDPIIKEMARIQKNREHEEAPTQQVKIFHRYVECIDKAKVWIELGNHLDDQKVIYQAVVEHTIREFHVRIDRDIQVLQDYLSQALHHIDWSEELKEAFTIQVLPGLRSDIERLEQLKQLPSDTSLQALTRWRAGADHARENCFSEALHIIDVFADERAPSPAPMAERENEHSVQILVQLTLLEENGSVGCRSQ